MKMIADHLSHVDVNHLLRLGAFDAGVTMAFPFMGPRTTRYLVEYFHARSPADRPPQRIPIQWTRCTFGGMRPWLTCLCGRRVGKLYYGNGFLACRPCGEMIYSSQRWGPKRRLYMQARMGDYDGRPGIEPFPPRRYRMHRNTYARLKMEGEVIERQLRLGRRYLPREHRNRPY